jgi:hypothetical protein
MAGVLLMRELVLIAVETCLPRRCIDVEDFFGPAIPAFSLHVIITYTAKNRA